jgi:mutator protein MutT
MAADRGVIVVLAAVIQRDERFLVTRRLAGTHLSGLWEFPGGKCDPGETHEACLARELAEELGVESSIGEEITTVEHAYPERTVRLHFRRCRISGEAQSLLGQEIRWVTREELAALEFPEADRELIELLLRQKAQGRGEKPVRPLPLQSSQRRRRSLP